MDYGGWLGLGDASIDSAEFLGSDINIFKLIMSCSVPHHGSRTGFTTAALPAALEHAIAVVSCQPSYSAYNHPHLESYENMVVNANLVPYLVTDDKDSRLHIQLKYRQLCEETNIPVDNPIPLKKAYFNMPSTNKLVITFECKVNDEDKPCSFIYEPPEYIEFSEDIEIDETDSAFPLT